MSKQIAVRLPDDLVAFIDEAVARGRARSRAELVARAVEGVRRQELAARDARILAGADPDADLDALAAYGAGVPMDDLD
jgi:Arc/MetJ-type ribon-helix-helix transcriptional regulator